MCGSLSSTGMMATHRPRFFPCSLLFLSHPLQQAQPQAPFRPRLLVVVLVVVVAMIAVVLDSSVHCNAWLSVAKQAVAACCARRQVLRCVLTSPHPTTPTPSRHSTRTTPTPRHRQGARPCGWVEVVAAPSSPTAAARQAMGWSEEGREEGREGRSRRRSRPDRRCWPQSRTR